MITGSLRLTTQGRFQLSGFPSNVRKHLTKGRWLVSGDLSVTSILCLTPVAADSKIGHKLTQDGRIMVHAGQQAHKAAYDYKITCAIADKVVVLTLFDPTVPSDKRALNMALAPDRGTTTGPRYAPTAITLFDELTPRR